MLIKHLAVWLCLHFRALTCGRGVLTDLFERVHTHTQLTGVLRSEHLCVSLRMFLRVRTERARCSSQIDIRYVGADPFSRDHFEMKVFLPHSARAIHPP